MKKIFLTIMVLISVLALKANITVTSVDTLLESLATMSYLLDLDNDGIGDYSIETYYVGPINNFDTYADIKMLSANSEIVPLPIWPSTTIYSVDPTDSGDVFQIFFDSNTAYIFHNTLYTNLSNTSDNYVALRLLKGGNPYADFAKGWNKQHPPSLLWLDLRMDGVITLGVTGTASAGVLGLSFEGGIALDLRGGLQVGLYGTLEHAVGADLSLGGVMNYHKPVVGNKNFSISSLDKWSESYNAAAYIFDGTYGGDSFKGGNFIKGINPENYSDSHFNFNTYGGGLSIGLPMGFTRNKGYTWTTPTIGFEH